LLLAVNLILVLTLITYALGNFKAIGLLLESVSGGVISFPLAIGLMALVMAVYESLGGMRGVVWTDVIQGLMLLLGCLAIFVCVAALSEPDSVTRWSGFTTGLAAYVADDLDWVNFLSLVVLIAFGAAVYPQALQRIYAARDVQVLRRSYRLMFFMPLLTTLPMLLVGMSVAEWNADLPVAESERVVLYAIERVVESFPFMAWLMLLCLSAALAAIMSTVDSALLTLGSVLTRDIMTAKPGAAGAAVALRAGRITSWLLMLLMAVLAIILPQTIWALMVFKFELLVQIAPAIILGVRYPRLPGVAVLAGLLGGVVVAVGLKLLLDPPQQLFGLHSGTWGLAANLVLLGLVSWRLRRARIDG
jgi:Na+/proline symporter